MNRLKSARQLITCPPQGLLLTLAPPTRVQRGWERDLAAYLGT